jgi:hypothetical protein
MSIGSSVLLSATAPAQVLNTEDGKVEIIGLTSIKAQELQQTIAERCAGKW